MTLTVSAELKQGGYSQFSLLFPHLYTGWSAYDLILSVICINRAFIIVILPCCVALTRSGPAEKTKLTFCNCVYMEMEVLNCVSVLV